MIVFCGGMIRSGSTLQFQIASRIIESRGEGERWPYLDPEPLEQRLRGLEGTPIHGVIKTHVLTPSAIARLRTGQARALYCFRDLRDVAVSAMRAFGHDWPNMKATQVLPNAVTDEALWRTQPGVLVQRYEQLVNDLPAAVAAIARHLGVTLESDEAEAIATDHSLEQQRRKIADWTAARGQHETYHPRELLHGNHIEKGEIGAWRHKLDPAIADEITTMYSDWLNAHGYPLISLPDEPETGEELCYLPHSGWLAYERGDAVLAGLREGDFEFAEQAFFHRVLRPGDTFVDCGAHSGLYTKLSAPLVTPGGCVHAIEPAPHSFDRLQRNTADLPPGSCKLHQMALGETNANVAFVASDEGLSAYNHVAGPLETGRTINVRQLTLPEFFKQNSLSKVDFLKIDAEGRELAILMAAAPLLSEGAIQALMIEFNQENLARYGGSCNALLALLATHDYKILALDRSQFRLVAARPSDQEGYANFFAVRNVGWLQRRFDDASPAARKISGEIMRRGAQVASHKLRLLANIAEQNTYIGSLRRGQEELNQAAASLTSQLDALAATSGQQSKYISVLEKERDRLTIEAGAAQMEAKRALRESQQHIDALKAQLDRTIAEHQGIITSLRVQLDQLAATAAKQTKHISVLSAERDRLSNETKTARAEANRAAREAQAHIDALKSQLDRTVADFQKTVDSLKIQLEHTNAEGQAHIDALKSQLDRTVADHQKTIDSLNSQLGRLATVSGKQAEYISVLEKERDRLSLAGEKLSRDSAHYVRVIAEQGSYIKLLEAQRPPAQP